MSENFVDIIGFQLEKVHTGVIGWLLDTENHSASMSDKIVILNKLLNSSLQDDDVSKIKPTQEYSFGRSRRIDLVVEVTSKKDDTRYLVIECKTDSEVDDTQLRQSKDAFLKKHPNSDCSSFVLTLGASQFTYQHLTDKIKTLGFTVLDVSKTRRLFSGLSIKDKSKIYYDDWCSALEREEIRSSTIDQVFSDIGNMKNLMNSEQKLKELGYRVGFPIFYTFYAKLREQLENGPYKNWAIFSGSNNPVMNWQDGCVDKGFGDELLRLYWEFNWHSLTLKAYLKNREKKLTERWSHLRDDVERLCGSSGVPGGRKTANKQGTWISIYKWDFDFCRESLHEIATKTNMVLEDLHEKLRNIVY